MELGQQRPRPLAHLAVAEPSAARQFAAGEDVARDRQVLEAEHLLVDHPDAPLERLARAAQVQALAAPVHVAGVRLDDARQDLQERGLAGAVLADESVRSEEHTSELQSLRHLVCRLLLEKKKY